MFAGFEVDPRVLAKAVRKLAEDNPDYVYPKPPEGGCHYNHGDGTGCIIGKGMESIGQPLPAKGAVDDGTDEYYLIGSYCSSGQWRLVFGLSEFGNDGSLDMDWMRAVQGQQDLAETWGDALKYADSLYPDIKAAHQN